ncbi:cyclase family protein [Archangium gephyra]|nr:cyclase family protein [Archangium gephyra]
MAQTPSSAWLDVSIPLSSAMPHYPGDPVPEIKRVRALEEGADANVTHLSLSAHAGTHVDAPVHFFSGRAGIDELPLDATMGRARVVHVPGDGQVRAEALRVHDPKPGEKLLLRTRNSDRRWWELPFQESFIGLTREAADFLAERRVGCVGVDYLSVAGFHEDSPAVHRTLLDAGIWIIEGLYLGEAAPGDYELVCLPLRVAGSDGAPARALLRPWTRG